MILGRPHVLLSTACLLFLWPEWSAWIDRSTGRVLKTELLIDARRFPDEIVTSFQFNRALQIGVPVEMRERYEVDDVVMTGVATYSQFRQYQVLTDERVR